jgi:hypothetical protein
MQPSLMVRCPKCGQPLKDESFHTADLSDDRSPPQNSKASDNQTALCACGAVVEVHRTAEKQMM